MTPTGKLSNEPDERVRQAGERFARLRVSRKPDYLLVDLPAALPNRAGAEVGVLRAVSEACRSERVSAVLIADAAVWVELSTMQLLELGSCMAKSGLRIAVLKADNSHRENVRFLDNVVWNRGGSLRFFDSREQAETWLGESDTPAQTRRNTPRRDLQD